MYSFYQKGSALILSLVFLLLLTILGVGAMQGSILQERMAGNSRDANIAFQAAEAALRAGEAVLQKTSIPVFDNSIPGYRKQIDNKSGSDYWMTYKWDDTAGTNSGSQKYTGSLGKAGESAPVEVPRFVIEELPAQEAGGSLKLSQLETDGYYRITARGVGATRDTVVIVQTVYKR